MNALRVRDLQKSYGDVAAVCGVSFDLGFGEVLGLLGLNGAGKTTTLECLLGLRRPDNGEITLEGHDARRNPGLLRRNVGAVLQKTALHDSMTPREALSLFARLHRRSSARAEVLLEAFSLEDKAGAPFGTLSGGQRQRLALALAHVHAPRILILDEPTAGLDPASRRDFHERILQQRTEGCAILLSTHDMAEAEQLCDRVAILHGGRILAAATPGQLIAHSGASPRVRLCADPMPEPAAVGRLEGSRRAVDRVTSS